MGRLGRWIELVLGEEKKFSVEERIFNAILFFSATASILLFISDVIQGLKPSIFLFSLAISLLLIGFNLLARKMQMVRKLVFPYSFLLVFVFIYVWFNNGGIEGTSLYYLFPMVIIIPLFVKGSYRIIIFLIPLLMGLVLLIIEINNPEIIAIIEYGKIRKIDNFLSAVLVSSSVLMGILLIIYSYRKEHQRVIHLNESKDKFFSIIAHDLKNPVGTINGLAKVLLDKYSALPAENRDKLINSLVQSSEETYNLLENLLQWARSESGMLKVQKEKLDIRKQILYTIGIMSEGIKAKGQNLITEINEEIYIQADRNMLDTVLRNLLSNAIKFTPEGGEIRVTAKRNGSEKASISFKDNGNGISKNDLEKIFNKDIIFTTQGTRKEKGTGLGLKLCEEFIQQNGGQIEVLSEVNIGTEFIITLQEAQ